MAVLQLALDNTYGALFVAVIVAAELHGVSCLQALYYFTHQKDSWAFKSLVAVVMIFDTVHQAMISYSLYNYLVTNFNNPLALLYITKVIQVEVFINGFTALFVQGFMTWRLWRLSARNLYLTIPVALLVLGEFGVVLAYTSLSFSLKLRAFTDVERIRSILMAINVLAAAGDILIAVILCCLLHRMRTDFQKSNTLINRLIVFTVNTGVITSMFAMASLISYLAARDSFWFIAFFFCTGRVYTNSLLATLNAREFLNNGAGVHCVDDNSLSTLRSSRNPNSCEGGLEAVPKPYD